MCVWITKIGSTNTVTHFPSKQRPAWVPQSGPAGRRPASLHIGPLNISGRAGCSGLMKSPALDRRSYRLKAIFAFLYYPLFYSPLSTILSTHYSLVESLYPLHYPPLYYPLPYPLPLSTALLFERVSCNSILCFNSQT